MNDIEIPPEFMQAICASMESAGETVKNHEDIISQYESANNPELGPALAAYMAAITGTATYEGSTCKFSRTFPEDDTAETLEEGTHPVLGGDNGTVHHLGGGTSQSKVPKQFWGTPAEWLAIQPVMIKENIEKQDATFIPAAAQTGGTDNADLLTPVLTQYVSEVLGGALG